MANNELVTLTTSEYPASTTIVATSAPDGRATVRLGGREFRITRRTEIESGSVVGMCPLELVGVSLAA